MSKSKGTTKRAHAEDAVARYRRANARLILKCRATGFVRLFAHLRAYGFAASDPQVEEHVAEHFTAMPLLGRDAVSPEDDSAVLQGIQTLCGFKGPDYVEEARQLTMQPWRSVNGELADAAEELIRVGGQLGADRSILAPLYELREHLRLELPGRVEVLSSAPTPEVHELGARCLAACAHVLDVVAAHGGGEPATRESTGSLNDNARNVLEALPSAKSKLPTKSQADIANKLGISEATVSRALGRLKGLGLVHETQLRRTAAGDGLAGR